MSQELRLRILSAIVLAAIVLVGSWYGGRVFALLAEAIAFLVYYEWTSMTRARHADPQAFWTGWVVLAILAFEVLAGEAIPFDDYYVWGAAAVGFAYAAIVARNKWNAGGIVYAGLTGLSLAAIRGDDLSGLVAILYIFAVVWSTDIAAYFTGRAIGGPKLAPAVSPGKTWSGALGGAVAAVICGPLLVLFYMRGVSIWIIGLSIVLSVLSQIGDLFESFMKRRYKVKDSSHLIPGHGGVMDRIDGLVFACFGAFLLKALMVSADAGVGAFLLGGSIPY